MAKEKNTAALDASADHFPEHGPVDKSGREVLLSLRHVDINFGKGENRVRAVQDVSFDIYKGETFSLVGESGSGKTTIGRAVIRANTCSNGEILYKGVRISGKIPHSLDREIIRNIQMVFQDPAASLNERATVDYIISEGLYNFHLYENEADRVRKVERIIEARAPDPLSSRVLGRPAPARGTRQSNGHGAGIRRRGRTHLRAGRLHPSADTEPYEQVPGGAGYDLHVHRPRPVHSPLYL